MQKAKTYFWKIVAGIAFILAAVLGSKAAYEGSKRRKLEQQAAEKQIKIYKKEKELNKLETKRAVEEAEAHGAGRMIALDKKITKKKQKLDKDRVALEEYTREIIVATEGPGTITQHD